MGRRTCKGASFFGLRTTDFEREEENKAGKQEMVEAAGVEPASEGVVSREPTYVVAFTPGLRPTFAARAENATRNASR